jgi:hypothetical protein
MNKKSEQKNKQKKRKKVKDLNYVKINTIDNRLIYKNLGYV